MHRHRRAPVTLHDVEQIVGRERNHVVCNRQLVRDVVVSRRVNSKVGRGLKQYLEALE
jgi:hypothetical protein